MAHYKSMFDYKYLGAWSLEGKDRTLKIKEVVGETLRNKQGTDRKPVVYFHGTKTNAGFALNKTNAEIIANLYGPDTTKWIGQLVTLYATQTQVGSKMVDCIRVRPQRPGPKAKAEELADVPVDEAMRAAQDDAMGGNDDEGGAAPAAAQ